jgi:hypothetical protein
MPSRSTKGLEQQVYEDRMSYKNPTEVAKPIIAESGPFLRKNRFPSRVPAATTIIVARRNSVATNSSAIGSCGTSASAALDATQQVPRPPSSSDASLTRTSNGVWRKIVLAANAGYFWIASARQLIEDRAFWAVVAVASIREFGERFAYRHHLGDFGVERRDVPQGQLFDLVAGAFTIPIELKQGGYVF